MTLARAELNKTVHVNHLNDKLGRLEQKRIHDRSLDHIQRVQRIEADVNRANFDTIQEHERLRKLGQI